MRIILQRVSSASVTVNDEIVGSIGPGLLLLVGMAADDTPQIMETMAKKIANLRIFPDDEGKMNKSCIETGGSILAVSQFTLFADCRKGRRPSYIGAAPPDQARETFEEFVKILRRHVPQVETGRFQAMMQVSLINDGPVTIILDSKEIVAAP